MYPISIASFILKSEDLTFVEVGVVGAAQDKQLKDETINLKFILKSKIIFSNKPQFY